MSIESLSATRQSYRWCHRLAQSHYENFPVASRLLPGRLRDPVAAIYAFARTADDVADEGDLSHELRLHRLDGMETALDAVESGEKNDSLLFQALADTIYRYRLPVDPFRDLLSAFRQDVSKTRYADFTEIMDYCRRSANPVGRLMLCLTGQQSEDRLIMSDALCSALQLINFLQDIDRDYREKHRIYIPQDELQRYAVSEEDIGKRRNSSRFKRLMHFQIRRAAQLLAAGSTLGRQTRGRFGLELRAIILGGSRILEKLGDQDNLFERPRLNATDRTRIIWGAFIQGIRLI
jgi:squalene synthase HpnC